MNVRKAGIEVRRLDDDRYAVIVDGLVRYVGAADECRRRALILAPKYSDRDAQARALGRLGRVM